MKFNELKEGDTFMYRGVLYYALSKGYWVSDGQINSPIAIAFSDVMRNKTEYCALSLVNLKLKNNFSKDDEVKLLPIKVEINDITSSENGVIRSNFNINISYVSELSALEGNTNMVALLPEEGAFFVLPYRIYYFSSGLFEQIKDDASQIVDIFSQKRANILSLQYGLRDIYMEDIFENDSDIAALTCKIQIEK